MTQAVYKPTLDPDFQNELTEHTTEHYEDTLRLLMQNLYPNGYGVGEQPETDKLARFQQLLSERETNMLVATAPPEQVNAGDAARAQNSLFELEKLRQELFGER